jgi:hypothetical protein
MEVNRVCNSLNCPVGRQQHPKGSDLIVIESPHLIRPRLRAGLDPAKINCSSRVLNKTPRATDISEQLCADEDGTETERTNCPRCPYCEYHLLTLSVELQIANPPLHHQQIDGVTLPIGASSEERTRKLGASATNALL